MNLEQINAALADFPAIAEEVIATLPLAPKEPGYQPGTIDIYFDDVLAVSQTNGIVTHELKLNPDYRPTVLTMYGDEELILVKAGGAVLLNRLPIAVAKTNWTTFTVNGTNGNGRQ